MPRATPASQHERPIAVRGAARGRRLRSLGLHVVTWDDLVHGNLHVFPVVPSGPVEFTREDVDRILSDL